jgi:hypothetical protein
MKLNQIALWRRITRLPIRPRPASIMAMYRPRARRRQQAPRRSCRPAYFHIARYDELVARVRSQIGGDRLTLLKNCPAVNFDVRQRQAVFTKPGSDHPGVRPRFVPDAYQHWLSTSGSVRGLLQSLRPDTICMALRGHVTRCVCSPYETKFRWQSTPAAAEMMWQMDIRIQ